MAQKRRKLKKTALLGIVVIVLLIADLLVLGFLKIDQKESAELSSQTTQISSSAVQSASRYEELTAINTDYIGYLSFESGLIEQPVVQTTDNSYYLDHDFQKEIYSSGTVFADKNCTLDSQNITLYGHYVYKDTSLMFSPLAQFIEGTAQISEHDRITFELKDEIRTYQIVYVYIFDMFEDGEDPYMTADFEDQAEFFRLMNYADKKSIYEADIQFEAGDRILTLQTCVRNEDYQREIVVAKEIDRQPLKK